MDLVRRAELLALVPRGRQLDERGRARQRRARAGQLDPVELAELGLVAQRAVAGEQRVLAARRELAGEAVGRDRPRTR